MKGEAMQSEMDGYVIEKLNQRIESWKKEEELWRERELELVAQLNELTKENIALRGIIANLQGEKP
jgi:hypothetical protein